MFVRLRKKLIAVLSLCVVALAAMVPAQGSAAPAVTAPQAASAAPEFLFSIAYRAPYNSGYLVRGDNKVLYALASYSGWFWSDNYLMVISRKGFTGNVSLSAVNLSAGVTSELPASVFVPKAGSVTVPIRLRASSTAPLVNTTVTLRGTSGNIVRSDSLQFDIVNQLPPLPN